MRWYQYTSGGLFLVVASVAVVSGCWWWSGTQPMRSFSNAVSNSTLDSEHKRFYTILAWDRQAWRSSLIHDLAGPVVLKRIVWQSKCLLDDGQTANVFVLDSFVTVAAPTPISLTCVVTDNEYRLLAWRSIASNSSGFISAMLRASVLEVTTSANWFHGTLSYSYRVTSNEVAEIGPPRTSPTPGRAAERTYFADPSDDGLGTILRSLRSQQRFSEPRL